MVGKPTDIDVLVIGAGPSGSAAAIWCAMQGLSVWIVEKDAFPRDRPGETLHPGMEVVLKRLGVYEDVLRVSSVRHKGIYMTAGASTVFKPYGSNERGNWRGFQVNRRDLDHILLQKAIGSGAELYQPAKVHRLVTGDKCMSLI